MREREGGWWARGRRATQRWMPEAPGGMEMATWGPVTCVVRSLPPSLPPHRCGPGRQEADEGQQSAPGLPAPGAAPVRVPGAAELMAAPPHPASPRPVPARPVPAAALLPLAAALTPAASLPPGPRKRWGLGPRRTGLALPLRLCIAARRPGLVTSVFLPSAFPGPLEA